LKSTHINHFQSKINPGHKIASLASGSGLPALFFIFYFYFHFGNLNILIQNNPRNCGQSLRWFYGKNMSQLFFVGGTSKCSGSTIRHSLTSCPNHCTGSENDQGNSDSQKNIQSNLLGKEKLCICFRVVVHSSLPRLVREAAPSLWIRCKRVCTFEFGNSNNSDISAIFHLLDVDEYDFDWEHQKWCIMMFYMQKVYCVMLSTEYYIIEQGLYWIILLR
jgi:hypothetical protein